MPVCHHSIALYNANIRDLYLSRARNSHTNLISVRSQKINGTVLPHMRILAHTRMRHPIRKKQRVYNRARRFHRENDWSEYKLLQKEVDQKLKHQHKSYISNLISASNNKKVSLALLEN